MVLVSAVLEIFQGPSFSIWDVITHLTMFAAPLWIAVLVGVLVGWTWKPRWANFNGDFSVSASVSSSSSTSFSSIRGMVVQHLSGFVPSFSSFKILQLHSCIPGVSDDDGFDKQNPPALPSSSSSPPSSSNVEKSSLVNEDDLKHICLLTKEKDDGPSWVQMMNRSNDNMTYEAWRRDPETGPPQYRTRTVYENATPELVRDFFWDDEFRLKWDDMLSHAETLEDCPTTGTMVVRWVRKFPFFCSDREYIMGRRIWRSGNTYYCVTKGVQGPISLGLLHSYTDFFQGVPNSTIPRRQKPRRVDLYYSSWCIRAVESRRGDQLTACEVLLFHHEDMGIPWEIAKLGVRQGMWGAVKKIDPALRAYQKQRASGVPLSRCASLAQINSKVSVDYLRWLESTSSLSEVETLASPEKPSGRNLPKYLVVGGAIALACTLDRGLLTKAVIFGVARRFVKMGKQL